MKELIQQRLFGRVVLLTTIYRLNKYVQPLKGRPYSRPKHDVSDTRFSLLNSYDTYPLPDLASEIWIRFVI